MSSGLSDPPPSAEVPDCMRMSRRRRRDHRKSASAPCSCPSRLVIYRRFSRSQPYLRLECGTCTPFVHISGAGRQPIGLRSSPTRRPRPPGMMFEIFPRRWPTKSVPMCVPFAGAGTRVLGPDPLVPHVACGFPVTHRLRARRITVRAVKRTSSPEPREAQD